jgi:hypothetical protein
MLFREVFLNDERIGLIGWDNGNVLPRVKDKKYDLYINSLRGTIVSPVSNKIGDISVSGTRYIIESHKDWLGALSLKQEKGIRLGTVAEIEKKSFNKLKI